MADLSILYLSAHPIDANDGPGLHIRAICRELSALGSEVTLVGPAQNNLAIEGVTCETLPLASGRKTRKHLKERLSALITSRKFDWAYMRGSLAASLSALQEAEIPIAVEYNGVLMDESKGAGFFRRSLYKREETQVALAAALALAVDQSVARRMVSLYDETGLADKIEVVENGCEAQVFAETLKEHSAERDTAPSRLVFVGALQPWTKLTLAFAALKQLPKRYSLSVIGDGPERSRFEALAQESGLEVEFLGRLSHSELAKALVRFDIGINPDAGRDSSPLKIPEYLAAGLAVVSAGPKSLSFLREQGFGEWLEGFPSAKTFALAIERISDAARFTQEERLWRSQWAVEHRSWRRSAKEILEHLKAKGRA